MKIFITGGTSGIGKQTVELLVSSSHEVIFSGRDADRGNKIAIATGAKFIQGDVKNWQINTFKLKTIVMSLSTMQEFGLKARWKIQAMKRSQTSFLLIQSHQ